MYVYHSAYFLGTFFDHGKHNNIVIPPEQQQRTEVSAFRDETLVNEST